MRLDKCLKNVLRHLDVVPCHPQRLYNLQPAVAHGGEQRDFLLVEAGRGPFMRVGAPASVAVAVSVRAILLVHVMVLSQALSSRGRHSTIAHKAERNEALEPLTLICIDK